MKTTMSKERELLTCRRILSFMVILSFVFQYMTRVNISIAIVDMVAKNNTSNTTSSSHFNWNEREKNEILGCFFWGYLATPILGGRFSEMYGTRKVLGISILLASLLTLITPIACQLNYYLMIAVRTSLGLVLGGTWPSLMPMAAKWIPPKERSKFMSHSAACSLGAASTFSICGYLIAYFGWPSVFYVTGSIALAWSLAWFYLIYDSPGEHPRISQREKEKLERENKPEQRSKEKRATPWKLILTSGPVWAIVVANAGLLFNFFFVVNELPTYIDQVLQFKIEQNGILSSFPYLATYFAALLACYLADRWHKLETFSVNTIRKIFTGLSLFGPGLLFLIQSFWGYDRVVSIIVFTLSLGFLGCYTAGFFANCLDIAPHYSGTIYGIANVCGGFTGYLTTKIVAVITFEKQDFEQWKYIFWILVIVDVICPIFYLIFASGELQSWDPKFSEEETENLRNDDSKYAHIQIKGQTT